MTHVITVETLLCYRHLTLSRKTPSDEPHKKSKSCHVHIIHVHSIYITRSRLFTV